VKKEHGFTGICGVRATADNHGWDY